mmetsp:Transcript_46855/g.85861  ORF Transcript_46855/g.85861 Transcript_46855/m.85861 type:complete len:208 (+) Transcript_46855:527-1150(+)
MLPRLKLLLGHVNLPIRLAASSTAFPPPLLRVRAAITHHPFFVTCLLQVVNQIHAVLYTLHTTEIHVHNTTCKDPRVLQECHHVPVGPQYATSLKRSGVGSPACSLVLRSCPTHNATKVWPIQSTIGVHSISSDCMALGAVLFEQQLSADWIALGQYKVISHINVVPRLVRHSVITSGNCRHVHTTAHCSEKLRHDYLLVHLLSMVS